MEIHKLELKDLFYFHVAAETNFLTSFLNYYDTFKCTAQEAFMVKKHSTASLLGRLHREDNIKFNHLKI